MDTLPKHLMVPTAVKYKTQPLVSSYHNNTLWYDWLSRLSLVSQGWLLNEDRGNVIRKTEHKEWKRGYQNRGRGRHRARTLALLGTSQERVFGVKGSAQRRGSKRRPCRYHGPKTLTEGCGPSKAWLARTCVHRIIPVMHRYRHDQQWTTIC